MKKYFEEMLFSKNLNYKFIKLKFSWLLTGFMNKELFFIFFYKERIENKYWISIVPLYHIVLYHELRFKRRNVYLGKKRFIKHIQSIINFHVLPNLKKQNTYSSSWILLIIQKGVAAESWKKLVVMFVWILN